MWQQIRDVKMPTREEVIRCVLPTRTILQHSLLYPLRLKRLIFSLASPSLVLALCPSVYPSSPLLSHLPEIKKNMHVNIPRRSRQ